MKLQDIMKRDVKCLSAQDTAQQATRMMRDENVGFLPICGENRKVVGTVTDRDIAIRLVANNMPAGTPLADIMTREVVACRPQDSLEMAQRLMAQHHKSRIMVVDDADKLVGIISLSDIAQQQRNGDADAADTLREVAKREARP